MWELSVKISIGDCAVHSWLSDLLVMLFKFIVNLCCEGGRKVAGILSSGRLLKWMLFVSSCRKYRWLSLDAMVPFQ